MRITHNEPGKGCAFLGDVTGSQGDFLRGAITSNADLETGARNDLKNRAAAMGGNVVYLLTQRAGQTGRKDHSEQTNVTLTGNVYRCSERAAWRQAGSAAAGPALAKNRSVMAGCPTVRR